MKALLAKLFAERVAEADDWPADHWLSMLANADAFIKTPAEAIEPFGEEKGGEGGGDGRAANDSPKESSLLASSVGSPLRFHYPFKKNDTIVVMCAVMAGAFDAFTVSTNLEAARVGGGVVGGVFGEGGGDEGNRNDGNEYKYAENPFVHAPMGVGDSLASLGRVHKQCLGYWRHRLARWAAEDARLWNVKFAVPPASLDDPRLRPHLKSRREAHQRSEAQRRRREQQQLLDKQQQQGGVANKRQKGGGGALGGPPQPGSPQLSPKEALAQRRQQQLRFLEVNAAYDLSDTFPSAASSSQQQGGGGKSVPIGAFGMPLLGIKVQVVAVPMQTTGLALDPRGAVMRRSVTPLVEGPDAAPLSARAVSHCVHRDPSNGDKLDGSVWRRVAARAAALNYAIAKGALHAVVENAIRDAGWLAASEEEGRKGGGDSGEDDEENAAKKAKKRGVGKRKKGGSSSSSGRHLTGATRGPLYVLGTRADFIVSPIPAVSFGDLFGGSSLSAHLSDSLLYADKGDGGGDDSSAGAERPPPPEDAAPWLWSDCLRLSPDGYAVVSRVISNAAQRLLTSLARMQIGAPP